MGFSFFISFSAETPARKELSPDEFSILKFLCCTGRLMSASINRIFFPAWARDMAREALTEDFPSPGVKLLTRRIFGGLSADDSKTEVLIPLKLSAIKEEVSLITVWTTVCFLSLIRSMVPMTAILNFYSTSSGVFTVLSRYSKKKARPIPPNRPRTIPRRIFLFLLGLAGILGSSAFSMIHTLTAWFLSVRSRSFIFLTRAS